LSHWLWEWLPIPTHNSVELELELGEALDTDLASDLALDHPWGIAAGSEATVTAHLLAFDQVTTADTVADTAAGTVVIVAGSGATARFTRSIEIRIRSTVEVTVAGIATAVRVSSPNL